MSRFIHEQFINTNRSIPDSNSGGKGIQTSAYVAEILELTKVKSQFLTKKKNGGLNTEVVSPWSGNIMKWSIYWSGLYTEV